MPRSASLAGKPARSLLRVWPFAWSLMVAVGLPALPAQGLPFAGQTAAPAASSSSTTQQDAPTHKRHRKKEAEPPPEPAPAPAPLNMLEQPATAATVTASGRELTVKADNSSLSQILHQVSTETGMKLDGLGGDERVFGSFGPGAPREVLTSLLNGTSYNILMVGALPNGAPRELMLTRKSGGGGAAPAAGQNNPPNNGNNMGDDEPPPPDDTVNGNANGDDSTPPDDTPPPMQYTPPSITPAPQTGPTPRTIPQQR